METHAVIVVVSLERAERTLLAGDMPCPRCRGVLRPFGNGRTRTVRGVGADTVTVTPRRARCADCQVTQILLPTELLVRRADSTEAIGNALVAKAGGAGFRSIAARFGGPSRRSADGCGPSGSRTRSGCTDAAWTAPCWSTGSCWSGRRRSGPLGARHDHHGARLHSCQPALPITPAGGRGRLVLQGANSHRVSLRSCRPDPRSASARRSRAGPTVRPGRPASSARW